MQSWIKYKSSKIVSMVEHFVKNEILGILIGLIRISFFPFTFLSGQEIIIGLLTGQCFLMQR